MKGYEKNLHEIILYEVEKGIIQRELGTLSDVKQPVIARVENGNTMPNQHDIGNFTATRQNTCNCSD